MDLQPAAEISSLDGERSPEDAPKKTRTRTGCLNCRRRRRKCDENRPKCVNCRQRGEDCRWGMKISFKDTNLSTLGAEHPSMQASSRKRQKHFEILDVTSKIKKGYETESSTAGPVVEHRNSLLSPLSSSSFNDGGSKPSNNHYDLNGIVKEGEGVLWQSYHDNSSPNATSTPSSLLLLPTEENQSHPNTKATNRAEHSGRTPASHSSITSTSVGDFGHGSIIESQVDPKILSPTSELHTEDAAADLLALRYLSSSLPRSNNLLHPSAGNRGIGFPGNEHISISDGIDDKFGGGDIFDNRDGIFLPGSAYRELHSTLRDHLIYTARSNYPTRVGTPELQTNDSFSERVIPRAIAESFDGRIESDPESIFSLRPAEISPQREYVFWASWLDEVAAWLDKFDNNRHFEHKIPMMAKTVPHLKLSILALSARQIEQKEQSLSSSESLSLYQEAIHCLLPDLQSKNTAVIASCVILCVLEMLSCAPTEWRRHLEGCANLLQAVGINGFSGGVEEALFWCFVRMDLCGALISQDNTLIPVSIWASKVSFEADIELFRKPSNGFDTYANYSVFLCASCVTYLHEFRGRIPGHEQSWSSRWRKLVGHLERWYQDRPDEMKPLLTMSSSERDDASPFPTVLYGNGPAVSGNQQYHTAMLLMLQEKPLDFPLHRKHKSIFWHARQICAISESNNHHGAWTNSIQPIWIAGKIMSHPSEHQAILNTLEKIERETGWLTGWRREDLKAWWGDSDD